MARPGAPDGEAAPLPDFAGPGVGSPSDSGDGLGRLAERLARRTARADAAAAPIAHSSESSPTQQLAAATPLPPAGGMPAETETGGNEGGDEGEGKGDVVEAVVDGRVREEDVELKVHWQGSFPSEDEWFPRDPLLAAYPRLVSAFEASLAARLGFEERPTETVDGVGPIFVPTAALRLHTLASERDGAPAGPVNEAAELPDPQVAIAQLRFAAQLGQRRAPEDADFNHARTAVTEAHHAVHSLKLRIDSSNGDAEGHEAADPTAGDSSPQAAGADEAFSQI